MRIEGSLLASSHELLAWQDKLALQRYSVVTMYCEQYRPSRMLHVVLGFRPCPNL